MPVSEALEFSSICLGQDIIFLSSLQTLYMLSNPSGEVLSQVVPHTSPIHTIRYSPELNTVATAAVGDRFISISSVISSKSPSRLGSLTCPHDVRTFTTDDDTLFAITSIGTLEIFYAFNTRFEPGKKGGLIRIPDAEVELSTTPPSKIEIQDITLRENQITLSWIQGAKTGFELIDRKGLTGKVTHNIELRRETTQQEVTILYNSVANPSPQNHMTNQRPSFSLGLSLPRLKSMA